MMYESHYSCQTLWAFEIFRNAPLKNEYKNSQSTPNNCGFEKKSANPPARFFIIDKLDQFFDDKMAFYEVEAR